MGSVRRVVALFTLLSAVAAVLFAGASYYFCPSMERAAKSCCCPAKAASPQEPAVSRAPCCDRNTISGIPSVPAESLRQSISVPAANAFVGELVPIADVRASEAPSAARLNRYGARAGPAPLFALHSAYLI
jgi:hypothetical protein